MLIFYLEKKSPLKEKIVNFISCKFVLANQK